MDVYNLLQSAGDAGKKPGDIYINCNGYMAFPGLINSHDHLDFNLFPLWGNRKYNNYVNGEMIFTCKIKKRLRLF